MQESFQMLSYSSRFCPVQSNYFWLGHLLMAKPRKLNDHLHL